MYARPLFVVVGILGLFWSLLPLARLILLPRLAFPAFPGPPLASPEAADIRWRHE